MKYMIVDTPKGQYEIPLQLIAEHRADYYAVEVDGHEKGSPEYLAEVEYAMTDSYEAKDWILNNTDWKDWYSVAVKINEKINVTDADFFTSSENLSIIEK